MTPAVPTPRLPVTVELTRTFKTGLALVPLVLGLVLAAVSPLAHEWLDDQIGISGPFGLVERMPEVWRYLVLGGAGLVVGLLMVDDVTKNAGVVVVHDDHLEVGQGEPQRWVARRAVGAAFRDGTHLVLLGRHGEMLARVSVEDLPGDDLSSALTAAGYPWREGGDPFAAEYRSWLDGSPELSAEQHALLRRRAEAENPETEAALDPDLREHGLVVRPGPKGRLEWRPARRP